MPVITGYVICRLSPAIPVQWRNQGITGGRPPIGALSGTILAKWGGGIREGKKEKRKKEKGKKEKGKKEREGKGEKGKGEKGVKKRRKNRKKKREN